MHTFLALAEMLKIRVIVCAHSQVEFNVYGDLGSHIIRVIDQSSEREEGKANLVKEVLSETAGLGVDGVLDLRTSVEECSNIDIIHCMGMHCRWVSCLSDLQLDPPESEQLFYRGASLAFLFAQSWLLAPSKQGKLMRMLRIVL